MDFADNLLHTVTDCLVNNQWLYKQDKYNRTEIACEQFS